MKFLAPTFALSLLAGPAFAQAGPSAADQAAALQIMLGEAVTREVSARAALQAESETNAALRKMIADLEAKSKAVEVKPPATEPAK